MASLLNHEGKADWFKQPNLSYEHRKEADEALRRLQEGMQSEHPAARNIVNVYALLKKHLIPVLEAKGLDKAQFADYLFNQVTILRIPLPHDTQLNHYFEIMNTRGEQLEKHEVLKATLMSKLQPEEHPLFHWIWEACADMNSYVQMNFSVENRTILFDENWRELQFDQFDSLREALFKQKDSEQKSKENSAPLTLNRLFEDAKKGSRYGQSEVGSEGTGEQERFGSIINFPNFLLQVLKVCYHRSEFYQEEKKIDEQIRLDDKGLIPIFETVLRSLDNEEKQAEFVKFFIIKLLFLRTQYDRYVIKREKHNGTESWSLKTIQKYDKNKVGYVNTFSDEGEDAKAVQLLEAMFHVSAPTQIYKHWLNALLYALFHAPKIEEEQVSASFLRDLRNQLYNLARSFMLDVYLAKEKTTFEDIVYRQKGKPAHDLNNIDWGRIDQGCSVHNFIFNFYDFITWQKWQNDTKSQNDSEDYSKFDFSYRTSVEHFYPQKPMKGYDCLNEDVLHSFGNLCLISSSMNSKFSNNMPKAKLANFGLDEEVRNGLSLKLLEMMDVVKVKGDWSENEIKVFNEEAKQRFQEALSNETIPQQDMT